VAVAKLPASARFVPIALPDPKEDRERRDRGVSIQDWLDAPTATRELCDRYESGAGCPALRCKRHLGRVGEAAGYSCEFQISSMPDGEDPTKPHGERTLALIGRVIGGTSRTAEIAQASAFTKLEKQAPEVLRSLGIRRR
jgi:hypothetical protein